MTMIYGQEVKVEVGSVVWPDGWRFAEKLIPETWDAADFRIPTPSLEPIIHSLAVKVKVTGRTWQRDLTRIVNDQYDREGNFVRHVVQRVRMDERWVRVQIEYVGDGEPSTFVGGWMMG